MDSGRSFRFRFRLSSFFVLVLGIVIGYALNVRTLEVLIGRAANETYRTPHQPYIVEPPDVLQVTALDSDFQVVKSVSGKHRVAPDGTISLGSFGVARVQGKTLPEVQQTIREVVSAGIDSPQISVELFAYNSKAYYVISKDRREAESVVRVPITGNETVLDGLSKIGAFPAMDAQIWLARPPLNRIGAGIKLPVDWEDITRNGSPATNFQLLPGDRLYISHLSGNSLD